METSPKVRELIGCEFRHSEDGTEVLRDGQVIHVSRAHTVESLERLQRMALRALDIQERRVTEGDRRWLMFQPGDKIVWWETPGEEGGWTAEVKEDLGDRVVLTKRTACDSGYITVHKRKVQYRGEWCYEQKEWRHV